MDKGEIGEKWRMQKLEKVENRENGKPHSQVGNFRIFISCRFSMKSILEDS